MSSISKCLAALLASNLKTRIKLSPRKHIMCLYSQQRETWERTCFLHFTSKCPRTNIPWRSGCKLYSNIHFLHREYTICGACPCYTHLSRLLGLYSWKIAHLKIMFSLGLRIFPASNTVFDFVPGYVYCLYIVYSIPYLYVYKI